MQLQLEMQIRTYKKINRIKVSLDTVEIFFLLNKPVMVIQDWSQMYISLLLPVL